MFVCQWPILTTVNDNLRWIFSEYFESILFFSQDSATLAFKVHIIISNKYFIRFELHVFYINWFELK